MQLIMILVAANINIKSKQMIIDTEKTNCSNCQYYEKYKTPESILNHPKITNPGQLMACNGKYGFGIVGPTFYCTKHTLKR